MASSALSVASEFLVATSRHEPMPAPSKPATKGKPDNGLELCVFPSSYSCIEAFFIEESAFGRYLVCMGEGDTAQEQNIGASAPKEEINIHVAPTVSVYGSRPSDLHFDVTCLRKCPSRFQH